MLLEIVRQKVPNKLSIRIHLLGQSEVSDKFKKIGDVQLLYIEVTTLGLFGNASKSFITIWGFVVQNLSQ